MEDSLYKEKAISIVKEIRDKLQFNLRNTKSSIELSIMFVDKMIEENHLLDSYEVNFTSILVQRHNYWSQVRLELVDMLDLLVTQKLLESQSSSFYKRVLVIDNPPTSLHRSILDISTIIPTIDYSIPMNRSERRKLLRNSKKK